MKHLKLFEGFLSDYRDGYNQIRSEYDEKKRIFLKDKKESLEEHIIDILDNYLIKEINTELYTNFDVRYQLEVPFEKIEDFIKDLKVANSRLNSYLELEVVLYRMELSIDIVHNHLINYGHTSSIRDLIEWREKYLNLQERARTKYKTLNLILGFKAPGEANRNILPF